MALNENLTWQEVGFMETNTNEAGAVIGQVREAFKGYKAEKKLIPAGMELYKFNGERKLSREPVTDDSRLSPWWSPVGEYEWDPGLQAKRKIASANAVSLREWGRLTSAIREDWSSLEWLLIVTASTATYTVGSAGSQKCPAWREKA